MEPTQLLEEFSYAVPLEHSNDKWVAFAWPQRIAQQCEDTEALLKQSRGLFQEEVGAKLHVMKKVSSFSFTRINVLQNRKFTSSSESLVYVGMKIRLILVRQQAKVEGKLPKTLSPKLQM